MSSKFSRQTLEFKRQRFLWLDQVLVDPELPASAFKVAYRISQGFNDVRYDGKAAARRSATQSECRKRPSLRWCDVYTPAVTFGSNGGGKDAAIRTTIG